MHAKNILCWEVAILSSVPGSYIVLSTWLDQEIHDIGGNICIAPNLEGRILPEHSHN